MDEKPLRCRIKEVNSPVFRHEALHLLSCPPSVNSSIYRLSSTPVACSPEHLLQLADTITSHPSLSLSWGCLSLISDHLITCHLFRGPSQTSLPTLGRSTDRCAGVMYMPSPDKKATVVDLLTTLRGLRETCNKKRYDIGVKGVSDVAYLRDIK